MPSFEPSVFCQPTLGIHPQALYTDNVDTYLDFIIEQDSPEDAMNAAVKLLDMCLESDGDIEKLLEESPEIDGYPTEKLLEFCSENIRFAELYPDAENAFLLTSKLNEKIRGILKKECCYLHMVPSYQELTHDLSNERLDDFIAASVELVDLCSNNPSESGIIEALEQKSKIRGFDSYDLLHFCAQNAHFFEVFPVAGKQIEITTPLYEKIKEMLYDPDLSDTLDGIKRVYVKATAADSADQRLHFSNVFKGIRTKEREQKQRQLQRQREQGLSLGDKMKRWMRQMSIGR